MLKNKIRKILPLLIVIIPIGYWVFQSGLLSPRPEEGVVDIWASWGDPPEQLQQLFDGYGQTSGAPVRVKLGVKSEKIQAALTGSEAPDLIILSSSDLVGAYHQDGLIEPLNDWIREGDIDLDDIYPAALAQCQAPDGGTYCLPWGSDVDALFWNKDLFAAAGLDPERPPQTMEELLAYAEKLTLRNEAGELSQVGFIPDIPRSHTDLYIQMFGGSLYRDPGLHLAADYQPLKEALDWQQQFYKMYDPDDLQDFIGDFTPYMESAHPLFANRRMSCQSCHRSKPIQNGKTPDTGFFAGRIAMMIDAQWQIDLQDYHPERSQVNYGVAPFPPSSANFEIAGSTMLHGPVVIIPAGAIDKDAAVHLLAWMMSPGILAEAAYANADLPTSRSAAADPRFHQAPEYEIFFDLIAHPNSWSHPPLPNHADFNKMMSEIEKMHLYEMGDPGQILLQFQDHASHQSNGSSAK